MVIRHIGTDEVFALPGLSPAIAVSSELILVSGQVAIGLDGQIVGKGDFQSQVEQTMQNLERFFRRRSFLQRRCSGWESY